MGKVPRMDTKQHALAAEIRAEAAAQRLTAKQLQRQVGVSSSAWSNYFVSCSRDVPIGVVIDVAHALGMQASELLRRAEGREGVDPIEAELIAGMSPRNQRVVAEFLPPAAPSSERPTRDHRSA